MTYQLGILQGDGIGPEVVQAAVTVVDAAIQSVGKVDLEWRPLPMGLSAIEAEGHPLPDRVKGELEKCHGWIMGPHDSVSYPDAFQNVLNPSGELRRHFDLYANIRPAKNFPNVDGKNMDLVIARENTEEFYPDRSMYQGGGEWMPNADMAISVGIFTRQAAERIAHVAFQLAQNRRKHVTIVHKANVLKLGMGLFLETCREVGKAYSGMLVDDFHIDAMAAHLVRRPGDFDVIVATNMFGDILSDLTSELSGSLGLGPTINHSADRVMAQAAHGSAPDIAGKGIANPVGEILSAAMLLRWLAHKHADTGLNMVAEEIEAQVTTVLGDTVSDDPVGIHSAIIGQGLRIKATGFGSFQRYLNDGIFI